MSWQTRIITVFLGVLLFFLVIYLLKRKKLEPEYALLWLLTGVSLLILALWEGGVQILTNLIGAKFATSTVLFFAWIFLGAMSLHYSLKISQLERKVKRLAQELSLLKVEKEH